jgi:hypothetical protein
LLLAAEVVSGNMILRCGNPLELSGSRGSSPNGTCGAFF